MASLRFGLLGDPVEHSRSPAIHDILLSLAGLEGEYLLVQSDSRGLGHAITELRGGQWDGLNVTMPLKEAAASAADTLSPLAKRAGSVNTLAHIDENIVGESTDATTVAQLVTDRFADLESVLVLGGGGSAAAALAGVGDRRQTYISSRRPEQAARLSQRLGGHVVPWGSAVAGALVINATPIGMAGEKLTTRLIEAAGGILDLPYAVEPTPTMSEAARAGIPRVDGNEFLMRQAIASFAFWTGLVLDCEEAMALLKKA